MGADGVLGEHELHQGCLLTFYLKKKKLLYCLFSLIVNQIHVHWRKAGSAKENNKIIKPPPIPQSPEFQAAAVSCPSLFLPVLVEVVKNVGFG